MKRICLLAVGVVVLAFPSAPQAQRPNALEGLPAVRVVIALDQNANDAGLIDGSLKQPSSFASARAASWWTKIALPRSWCRSPRSRL